MEKQSFIIFQGKQTKKTSECRDPEGGCYKEQVKMRELGLSQ